MKSRRLRTPARKSPKVRRCACGGAAEPARKEPGGLTIGGARAEGGPPLMAHELAHAAEREPVARRRIATEMWAESLIEPFFEEYGANFFVHAPTQLSSPFTETSGALPLQIVQNMMYSERVFHVAGTTVGEVMLNLEDHVLARESIIDYAKAFRSGFSADIDIDDHSWEKFSERLEDLKAGEYARLEKIYEGEKLKAEKSQVEGRAMFDLLNRSADAARHSEDDLHDLLWVIEGSDKKKPSDLPDEEYRFRMNCLLASLVVMFGGSQGQVAYQELDARTMPFRQGPEGELDVDKRSRNWKDWIPGDWGYIESTNRPANADRGEEGENIVYLGGDLWWGHLPGDDSYRRLEQWLRDVDSWPGDAVLQPIRAWPVSGLADQPNPFINTTAEADR